MRRTLGLGLKNRLRKFIVCLLHPNNTIAKLKRVEQRRGDEEDVVSFEAAEEAANPGVLNLNKVQNCLTALS